MPTSILPNAFDVSDEIKTPPVCKRVRSQRDMVPAPFCLLVAYLVVALCLPAGAASKSHVLFIVADDHGFHDCEYFITST